MKLIGGCIAAFAALVGYALFTGTFDAPPRNVDSNPLRLNNWELANQQDPAVAQRIEYLKRGK